MLLVNYLHKRTTPWCTIIHTVSAIKLCSALFCVLTYKLLFWSERSISIGTVCAVLLLSAALTALLTNDFVLLSEAGRIDWNNVWAQARAAADFCWRTVEFASHSAYSAYMQDATPAHANEF